MNNVDMHKLEAAVIKMIEETLADGKDVCLFNQHSLLLSMQVSSLKSRHMHTEISDMLSGASICNKYGIWATGEHESDVRYMVRLAKPKQGIESVSYHAIHTPQPRTDRKNQFTLEVPKGISEEQAQHFITVACSTYLNTGNVADMHDEDLRRQGVL